MERVIVIGGGAAGMMAAIAATNKGKEILLLEKNEKLGKKVYITGKGRCNITNDSDVENLLANVVSNPRFLYSAFYTFDSFSMMEFLREEGLSIKTERGNRVFPSSDKSSDVIRTLQTALKKRGVTVRLYAEVKNVVIEQEAVTGVVVKNKDGKEETISCSQVIVATGGNSYASTGSTGDGYRFGKKAGHTMKELHPALVPLETKEKYIPEMQGLSLKNVVLRIKGKKKPLYEEQGEMLFTHFGISGPLVLSASSKVTAKEMPLFAEIDLKPALSEKQLDERIVRDFSSCQNSLFKNSLGKLLPSKMIPVIVELSGIPEQKQVNEVSKEERQKLVHLIKGFPLTIVGTRNFNEAIITQGGINVKEINPATMESKKVKGLYFAGEVLDLDAYTGGYNLQIAWSTGYLAGMTAGEREENENA